MTSVIKRIARMLAAAALLYLLYLGVAYSFQDELIFPGTRIAAPEWNAEPPIELWKSPIEDGHVEAIYAPRPGASAKRPAPLLVFLHGNGGLIDWSLSSLASYHALGFSVLVPEYRGYGRSAGRPGQRVIVEDALKFIERAVARDDVDGSRVVYQGQSLGGGVAVAVAHERPPAALILESTFTSVSSFARSYFAPGLLVRSRFETAEAIGDYGGPTLLMHATGDPVIPYAMGVQLAELGRDVQFETFDGDAHVLPGPDDAERYWSLIETFTRRTVSP